MTDPTTQLTHEPRPWHGVLVATALPLRPRAGLYSGDRFALVTAEARLRLPNHFDKTRIVAQWIEIRVGVQPDDPAA